MRTARIRSTGRSPRGAGTRRARIRSRSPSRETAKPPNAKSAPSTDSSHAARQHAGHDQHPGQRRCAGSGRPRLRPPSSLEQLLRDLPRDRQHGDDHADLARGQRRQRPASGRSARAPRRARAAGRSPTRSRSALTAARESAGSVISPPFCPPPVWTSTATTPNARCTSPWWTSSASTRASGTWSGRSGSSPLRWPIASSVDPVGGRRASGSGRRRTRRRCRARRRSPTGSARARRSRRRTGRSRR